MAGPLLNDGVNVVMDADPADLDPADGFVFEDDSEAPSPVSDPSAYTVDEVNDYLAEHPMDAEAVLAAEAEGDARKGILEGPHASKPAYDPSKFTVGEVKSHVEKNPDERDAVLAAEKDGKNRSTLVKFLEEFQVPESDEATSEGVESEENDAPAGDGAGADQSEED
jgi:hypothetical protein